MRNLVLSLAVIGIGLVCLSAVFADRPPNQIAESSDEKPQKQDVRAFLCNNPEPWIPMESGEQALMPFVIAGDSPDMPGGGRDGSSGCGPVSCTITCTGGNTCSAGPCTAPRFYASCTCSQGGSCIGGCIPCGR